MLWAIVIILLSITLRKIFLRYKFWSDKGIKQTPYGFIWGDIWGVIFRRCSFSELLQEVYNMYPKTRYTGMFFLDPILLIKDPDLIKQITIKNFDHFVNHQNLFPEEDHPFLCRNIFNQKDSIWREMRSTLSPVFTSSKMKSMFGLIQQNGEKFVSYFLQQNEDIIVNVKDSFTKIASDVIGSITFGVDCDSLSEPKNEYYLMSKSILENFLRSTRYHGYMLFPQIYRIFKISPFPNNSVEYFFDLVKTTVQYRENHNVARPDMLNILLEARRNGIKYEEHDQDTGFSTAKESDIHKNFKSHKSKITDEEIASQGFGFFFAGYESVANLMSFMSYELALNPDVQEKLIQEVDDINNSYGKLSYENLMDMKYLDMVVSETLRKWPPNNVTNRVCNKNFVIEPQLPHEKMVVLEKGTFIWFPIYALHRNPDFFPEPEKFDPERFNEENKKKIVPCSFMPFGSGPRNCIGSRLALLETKIVMFHVLTYFRFFRVGGTPVPLELKKGRLTMVTEEEIWVGMKRRHEKQDVL